MHITWAPFEKSIRVGTVKVEWFPAKGAANGFRAGGPTRHVSWWRGVIIAGHCIAIGGFR